MSIIPWLYIAHVRGGLGLLAAPASQSGPARSLALLGAVMEAAALERMTRRIGMVAEPYHTGRGGAYLRAGKALAALGAAGAALSGVPAVPAGRPRRVAAAASGAAPIGASAATRWGIFRAGMASAGNFACLTPALSGSRPRSASTAERRRTDMAQTCSMPWPGGGRGPCP